MIKEIYIRNQDDPYYVPNLIEHSNELEMIISQIKILLSTENGNVLGNYNLGTNIENEIFKTKKNAQVIKTNIENQISLYVMPSNNFTITVEVNFGDSGEGYDYGIIDIYINGNKTIGFLVNK